MDKIKWLIVHFGINLMKERSTHRRRRRKREVVQQQKTNRCGAD